MTVWVGTRSIGRRRRPGSRSGVSALGRCCKQLESAAVWWVIRQPSVPVGREERGATEARSRERGGQGRPAPSQGISAIN